MIVLFADDETEDIFNGLSSKAARRRLPLALWPVAQRKPDRLNRAADVRDLGDPPGNRLEALKGDRMGSFSIRINEQYRVVFEFSSGNARNVLITDYH
jgi:proteic killer suppression protein